MSFCSCTRYFPRLLLSFLWSAFLHELSSVFCQNSEELEVLCLHIGCIVCFTASQVKSWAVFAGITWFLLLCGTSESLWEAWKVLLVQLLKSFSTASKWLFYHFKIAVVSLRTWAFWVKACFYIVLYVLMHAGFCIIVAILKACLSSPRYFILSSLLPLPCHPLEILKWVNCAIAFFTSVFTCSNGR